MESNYLVQRKINESRKNRRKIAWVVILGAILLVLILVGLIKVIVDEKKAEGGNTGNKSQVTQDQNAGNTPKPEQSTGTSQNVTVTPTPTPLPTATPTPTPVPAPKIIVDAGHGGEDRGSVRNGLNEKDANLAIALYLQAILKDAGYEVFMIRDDDTTIDNKSRPETAIAEEGDLFVSIHLNSLDGDSDATQGVEVWYSNLRDDDSGILARYVVDEVAAAVDTRNRGIKLSNNLIVLKYNGMPSCLVECGFITSKTEREKLFSPEYQNKLAEGIANGIMRFLPIE